MTVGSTIALFFALTVMAAIPSLSVFLVASRSAALGFPHGAMAAAGVVAGDLIFIMVAVFGLAFLAGMLGEGALVIGIVGGVYLIWLGLGILRRAGVRREHPKSRGVSLLSSFLAGLLLTLGDQKAIIFYLGFLPAFVDVQAISLTELLVLMAVTIGAVGGTKLLYAYLAGGVARVTSSSLSLWIQRAAGCLLLLVGLFSVARAIF